jgi:imidazole glycerol-phosphate synthase subunit HisH
MRSPRVGIVTLGACNRRSVTAALERAGATVAIVEDEAALQSVEAVVLPGVANFGFVARALDALALRDGVLAAASAGIPILGICAGYQLLFENSDEAPGVRGLGIFAGSVRPLRGPKRQHVGWNRVVPTERTERAGWAYFAHAYAPGADVEGARATTTFGDSFASIARAGAVTGMQFHPERSGEYGARALQAFLDSIRCAYVV